jgi:hypothetical protein
MGDHLESLPEAACLGVILHVLGFRLSQPEQFIGRNPEGLGQIDERGGGRDTVVVFGVGNGPLGGSSQSGRLHLRETASFPERCQAEAKVLILFLLFRHSQEQL